MNTSAVPQDQAAWANERAVKEADERGREARFTALHAAQKTHGETGNSSEVLRAAEAYCAFLLGTKPGAA